MALTFFASSLIAAAADDMSSSRSTSSTPTSTPWSRRCRRSPAATSSSQDQGTVNIISARPVPKSLVYPAPVGAAAARDGGGGTAWRDQARAQDRSQDRSYERRRGQRRGPTHDPRDHASLTRVRATRWSTCCITSSHLTRSPRFWDQRARDHRLREHAAHRRCILRLARPAAAGEP